MLGASLKILATWLPYLPACTTSKFPKIWRRALVVAVPKPSKPVEGPKELSSRSPCSVFPTRFSSDLIYARVEPLIDPLLPRETGGFSKIHRGSTAIHCGFDKIRSIVDSKIHRGRSTVDQVTLLTQSIKKCIRSEKRRPVPSLST